MEFQSPLARARGLGSAHHGATHWWRERISALLLLPTGLWFAVSLARLPDVTTEAASEWVASPVNALLLIVYVVTACYHAALGIRVIMEDYITRRPLRMTAILFANGTLLTAALLSVYAVLHIALGT
ncbi:succinate dehydrogenase, hydrophobic membrane anchor protein [Methylolobus aquaticus]